MPLRHAGIPLISLTLIGLFSSLAFGWPLKNRCCHDDCQTQTIKIPGQKIDIQAAAPKISVRESFRAGPALAPVGAIYMPVALPMAGFPDSGPDSRGDDHATEAYRHQLAADYAYRHAQADAEHHQRRMEQLRTARAAMGPAAPAATPASATPDANMDKILAQLDEIKKRLDSVEKLVQYHDNLIWDKLKPKTEK